ncbi:prenyltransferase/squalene oxidase repeat-containing protein [Chitinophaga dinghuensis]|nr:hypothetical protein [Chitinophaga dinghuensis]
MDTWADSSSIYHKDIAEIFLELDVLPTGVQSPLLFFDLSPALSDSQKKELCVRLLQEMLGEKEAIFSILDTILHACPQPAFLAYAGIMFSRDTEVLRLNIKKLPLDKVLPFLQQIGYSCYDQELTELLPIVFGFSDRVTLCIDVKDEILPKISFECFLDNNPEGESYWKLFIEKFNTDNLLDAAKIDAALTWTKDIFPSQQKDWPEHLWIASLYKSENEFTFLRKFISHIKVTYCPGKRTELKAYLAYESTWANRTLLAKNPVLSPPTEALPVSLIAAAIKKGVDFIINNQQQAGWWKDFRLSPGTSDEWVTAYVGCHLARHELPETYPALKSAWNMLKTRYRTNEGWGYNALTPADADSTIWTWMFTTTGHFQQEFPTPGQDLLHAYLTTNGGVTTYSESGPLGRNQPPETFNGWKIPHCCVTAAFALAGIQPAIDYLLNHQYPAGYWYSYWWEGPVYATALAVEALCNKDALYYKTYIDNAVNWALNNINETLTEPSPNPFNIALLLKILLFSNQPEKYAILANGMVNQLLQSQTDYGNWMPAAEMRFPNTDDIHHESGENVQVVTDQKMNFTTITVLDALRLYLLSGLPEYRPT